MINKYIKYRSHREESEGLKGQLIKGGLGSILLKGGYVLLELFTGILLARLLGVEEYGNYSFVLAGIGLLSIFSQVGFPGYLVKSVAVYKEEKKFSHLKGLLSMSMRLTAFLSIITSLIIILVIKYPLYFFVQNIYPEALSSLLLLPLVTMLAINNGVLRGLGYVVIGQLPGSLIRSAYILLSIGIWFVATNYLTAYDTILLNVFATFCALTTGVIILHYKTKTIHKWKPVYEKKKWVREAFPFLMLAAGQIILYRSDILMIGIFLDSTEVGLYRVAVQIADGIGMIMMALSMVITPHLARLYSKKNWKGIVNILVSSHRIAFTIILPLVTIFILFNDTIIGLIFGFEYIGSGSPLNILLIGKLVYSTIGFFGVALSMFGFANIAAIATYTTAFSNILLNTILIPPMGILGAAIATVVSSIFINAILAIWVHKKYRKNMTALGKILK